MKTFRFLEFPVYRQSKRFYLGVLLCTKGMALFSLKDQVERAALSVVLNIAEGSAKSSDKDFARYLQISIGSMNEVVSCLDIMKDRRLLTDDVYQKFFFEAESITKQLGGFTKKLRSKS